MKSGGHPGAPGPRRENPGSFQWGGRPSAAKVVRASLPASVSFRGSKCNEETSYADVGQPFQVADPPKEDWRQAGKPDLLLQRPLRFHLERRAEYRE